VPIVLQKSQKLQLLNSRQERNKRQSPFDRAANPLPESPVSLACGDVVPTSLFNRRAHASENLRPMPQKDFCNTICQFRKSLIFNYLFCLGEQFVGRLGRAAFAISRCMRTKQR
jgi:hypothetical protein